MWDWQGTIKVRKREVVSDMSVRPRATDEARVIQVIETISNRGAGTLDDPCRPVKQYWDFDGKFLAEFDPCLPNEDTKDIRYINRMKREKRR